MVSSALRRDKLSPGLQLSASSICGSGSKNGRKYFSLTMAATLAAALFFFQAHFKIATKVHNSSVRNTDQVPVGMKEQQVHLPVSDKDGEARDSKGETKSVLSDDNHEDATLTEGERAKCLNYVFYDKPVKTGSTAVMFAIRKYLNESGRWDRSCSSQGYYTCIRRAQEICDGTVKEDERYSIIGHYKYGPQELIDCLRSDYYVVTSAREPYQRRKSTYLWNRTMNATFFNIPHTLPFSEFMNRLPRCQLYHYYDGLGNGCNGVVPFQQRAKQIVDRVDEVIDIYDEVVGPLHKKIRRYLAKENESIKVEEDEYIEEFDRDTLKEEQYLYDLLRERRLKKPDPSRLPC